jgi:hypothetical protein
MTPTPNFCATFDMVKEATPPSVEIANAASTI